MAVPAAGLAASIVQSCGRSDRGRGPNRRRGVEPGHAGPRTQNHAAGDETYSGDDAGDDARRIAAAQRRVE